MPEIHLKYGRTAIPFAYDQGRFEILEGRRPGAALSAAE